MGLSSQLLKVQNTRFNYVNASLTLLVNNTLQFKNASGFITGGSWTSKLLNWIDFIDVAIVVNKFYQRLTNYAMQYFATAKVKYSNSSLEYSNMLLAIFNSRLQLFQTGLSFAVTPTAKYNDARLVMEPALYARDSNISLTNSSMRLIGARQAYFWNVLVSAVCCRMASLASWLP